MYDVAIIGAGVVGGMIARALSGYDLQICILEKENDVAMGATKANSAIVHAGFDAKPGSLKARLNVRGALLMPQITRELGVSYRQNGSLVIGFSDEDRKVLEKLYAQGQENGVPQLELLDGSAARALEPALSEKVTCALHAPTGAITCPYELTVAAIGNAMDNGAELKRNFPVNRITREEGFYRIYEDGEWVDAKYTVNAAGLFSDEIAAMIGDTSFTVHPRRGEYILLDKDCGVSLSHTVFRTPGKMGKGILVTPTVDGNLLTGPTSVDIADKEEKGTTDAGMAQVMAQAQEDVPGIPYRQTITSFCGLRAVGSTGDFIIRAPEKGFIHVAGIESPGLSASPAIAEYVLELLREQGLPLRKKENYQPCRRSQHFFRLSTVAEKNEIIRKEPAYGKIVCRCEQVTEGEILYAIRTNPGARDLDGIKRRTRAQMGRCQGGFCMPQVAELLARELGIGMEQVTKSGKSSCIHTGYTKGGAQ